MDTFLIILAACLLISLCVWVAILLLLLKRKTLQNITINLVALSAGALMGGAFLHLLPEASEALDINIIYPIVLVAFIFFFLMEKLLFWRHCHNGVCPVHTFGYMNLFGDSIHNFIDGMVIASTFLIDFNLGVATTLAIALHEIPQEIGDFGVLLHAGFHYKKALIINFLVALMVVAGGIAGYFLSFYEHNIVSYLVPFAAGGFIYIAASDLMPEIKKEKDIKKSLLAFLVFVLGIGMMYAFKFISH